ncbi:hypothetical protein C2845_PM18G05700 [Panicum miliaceum]|uniref:FAR1 domain-containing protein n=1 Tax=Panicum miliaceum TaxID=4540 RepID=A0A3L6PN56_PANMI|nr:hypothetical protein C2845_PM18G05700 [Panicum miliaceum]
MDPRSGAAEIVRWRDAGAPCASAASVGEEEQEDTEGRIQTRINDSAGDQQLELSVYRQGTSKGHPSRNSEEQRLQLERLLTSSTTRIRKRATNGPAARIEPCQETAVSRALRQHEKNGSSYVFYPAVGTDFNSCEEAHDFYNLYSWERGFGIRYGRSRTNSNSYKTKQDIICSCQGRKEPTNISSCRTGCQAMIRLLRTEDHGWYISMMKDEHNHPLSNSYAENKQWNSHNQIDAITMDFIKKLRENNVSISRV